LRWHHGPIPDHPDHPDPGDRWCYDCGSQVFVIEHGLICSGCTRQEWLDSTPS
jgi:hypothetical protein